MDQVIINSQIYQLISVRRLPNNQVSIKYRIADNIKEYVTNEFVTITTNNTYFIKVVNPLV